MEQLGGGKCSLCGSDGTNKSTCPLNKDSTSHNYQKHYLCKPQSDQKGDVAGVLRPKIKVQSPKIPVPITHVPIIIQPVPVKNPIIIQPVPVKNPIIIQPVPVQLPVKIPQPIPHPEAVKSDFTMYRLSDFRNLSSPIGGGTYGQTVRAIRVSDGVNVVLKKYLGDHANPLKTYIPTDIVRELSTIQKLNTNPNCAVVKLYGICVADNNSCIYMVLEPLSIDLYQKYILKTDKLNEYKKILYKMLLAISHIHSMGIVHNDIKPANVMLTMDETDIRFIDFGISSFLGLSPSTDILPNYQSTSTIEAPDKYVDINGKHSEMYGHSYNSDIFSIACTMVQIMYGNAYYKPFVGDNGTDLMYTDMYTSKVCSNRINTQIDTKIGFGGSTILMKMLNSMSIKRSTAKDLLLEPYFDDMRRANSLIKIGGAKEFIVTNMRHYNEYEIEHHSYELEYIDEIHNNYVNDIIEELPTDTTATMYINTIRGFILETRQVKGQPIDALLHTIDQCRHISKTDSSESRNLDLSLIQYLNLSMYTYEQAYKHGHYLLSPYSYATAWERTKKLLAETQVLNIMPVMTHVSYIIVKLTKMFVIDK